MRYRALRQRMVREQLVPRGIHDPAVLEAMERVPRHRFVDQALAVSAYRDHPLPIGHGQTISQPYIVALMTQELGLCGSESVLEVGTGCGYQTAVLAGLARRVCTVERLRPLARQARLLLSELGIDNVLFRVGDGSLGWPALAPFDAIIVTAAAPAVPDPLVDQLADGGRMVIPVGDRDGQSLAVVEKDGGRLRQRVVEMVRFVSLVGEAGWDG